MTFKGVLLEYVQATADANGQAVASIGPSKWGDRWEVTSLSTSTTGTAESRLRVFRNSNVPSAQFATTYSGNSDTAGGSTETFNAGDKLVFQWDNATPGAICSCTIGGTRYSERF